MDYFIETLKKSTKKIVAEFDATKSVWHNPTVGMLREKIIKSMLEPYIPDCYGISGGLCYDSEENKSKQLDLVLYDKMYSFRLPFDDDFIVFPCESVYGNIEIKTNLNKETVQQSIDNIASLKSLKREDATEFNFTPQCELRINNQKTGTKKNEYFGLVFAYESSNVDTIMNNIRECNMPKDSRLLPDAFILLDKKAIIFKADINNKSISLNGETGGYVSIKTGDDTISYFIMIILTLLYSMSLKAINPGHIWGDDIINNYEKVADWDKYLFLNLSKK